MSDPIQRKGPGGATGVAGGTPADGAAYRAAVDGAHAGRAEGTQAGEIASIAAEIKAGTLDPGAAVERLVQRALASGVASGLAPAQRERLADALRAQLANDPALVALTRELGR
jgi:hypothetical protein